MDQAYKTILFRHWTTGSIGEKRDEPNDYHLEAVSRSQCRSGEPKTGHSSITELKRQKFNFKKSKH